MAGTYEVRGKAVRFRYTGTKYATPIRETFHGLSGKRAIQRRLNEWTQEVESGRWHERKARESRPETVESLIRSWLGHAGVRASTLKGYRNLAFAHVVPVIGSLRIELVRTADCQRVIDLMRKRGLKAKTAANCLRVMTAAFKFSVRQGLRDDNPADGGKVVLPPAQHPRVNVPDPKRIKEILREAESGPHYVELLLAAETGLRRSEILGLAWSNIDLDSARLRVVRTLHSDGGKLYFEPPKTARSRRTIGLSPRVVAALKRHRASQAQRRLAAGDAWQDWDVVFDRGDGRPVHPNVLSRYFNRLSDRLGLEHVRLHDLRHAFATNLMGLVGTKDTSAALGHASEAFTMHVYQHVVPDANAELVVKAITKLYGEPG